MKGFRKMAKITWKYYLAVFLTMMMLVVCDSIFICKDNKIAFMGSGVENQIQEQMSKTTIDATQSWLYTKNLSEAIDDKGTGLTFSGYFMTLVGIIVILCGRNIAFADCRTREFQMTWPVKNTVKILYDYIATLAIILAGGIMQTIFLIVSQTRYNDAVLRIMTERGIMSGTDNIIEAINSELLIYMGTYMLFIVLGYTWIYLSMTLAKNPMFGIVSALITWGSVYFAVDHIRYGIISYFVERNGLVVYEEGNSNVLYGIIESILYPPDYFWGFNGVAYAQGGYSYQHALVVLVLVLLAMLFALLVIAKKRELSKGRFFCVPCADYTFSFLIGVVVTLGLEDYIGYKSVIVGIAVVLIMIGKFHLVSKQSSNQWEVK